MLRTFASSLSHSRPRPQFETTLTRSLASHPAEESSPAPQRSTKSKTESRQKLYTSKPIIISRNKGKDVKGEKHIFLLKPYELSKRLKALGDAGKVDEAVEYLKNSPLDAQNIPVWNTMIDIAMKARKFKLAFELYVDMKRRGFVPNNRTFTTLFAGYDRIEDWHSLTQQLERVHQLYDAWRPRRMEFINGSHEEQGILSGVISMYINILARAGLHQKMFEVYYDLDEDGPFSANRFVYANMFKSLLVRFDNPEGATDTLNHRKAADAKFLWKRMEKQVEKQAEKPGAQPIIDSFVVVNAVRCLLRGRASEQLLAFDIVRDYLGFTKPGEPPVTPKIPFDRYNTSTVLSLCFHTQKYRLCIQWAQQIMEKGVRQGNNILIDENHMTALLQSYAALSSLGSLNESQQAVETLQWMKRESAVNNVETLAPTFISYTLAMVACWRGGDWSSALRTFELMTGYNGKDFLDGVTVKPRRNSDNSDLTPDTAFMSLLARIALASGDAAIMRQCLRIANQFEVEQKRGYEYYATLHTRFNAKRRSASTDSGAEKVSNYYTIKYAQSIVDLVEGVEKKSSGTEVTEEEHKRWKEMRRSAQRSLLEVGKGRDATMPAVEESPLGSSERIAQLDEEVASGFASRMSSTGY
ncbi:hypothetical protein C8Q75DRAFT_741672 [Abortiporus biennis]|nr:hypothetical protein C8Q75DRAFT_741672 [Abortiporus biennis]